MLNGSLISGATNSTYTALENGDYQVIVSDERGCSDTSEIYTISNVGINNVHPLAGEIYIYPNPGSEILNFKSPIEISVSIHTVEGKIIKKEQYTAPIDITNLATGFYLIKIYDRSGNLIKTEKFIKKPTL